MGRAGERHQGTRTTSQKQQSVLHDVVRVPSESRPVLLKGAHAPAAPAASGNLSEVQMLGYSPDLPSQSLLRCDPGTWVILNMFEFETSWSGGPWWSEKAQRKTEHERAFDGAIRAIVLHLAQPLTPKQDSSVICVTHLFLFGCSGKLLSSVSFC